MKLKFYKIPLFVGLQFLYIACGKPCYEKNYVFNVYWTFVPISDSIKVGDTLWLTSTVYKPMTDTISKKQISYNNADDWGTTLIISDINKFTDSKRGAIDSFTYVSVKGSIYSDSSIDTNVAKQVFFQETSSDYELRVGLVALKKGTYILGLSDNPALYQKNSKGCGISKLIILNQNADKHLYLFENKWGLLSSYDAAHNYCVKVY